MNQQIRYWIIFILAFIFVFPVEARLKRVNQIPNGTRFGCANCHINPAGGGTRNLFGQQIEANFLTVSGSDGDVTWNATLASLDADNDGSSNGQELQDPTGSWQAGQAQPGTASLVTNPGDPASTPTTAVEKMPSNSLPLEFKLEQNYPNPFNPETEIRFSLPQAEQVDLTVFNLLGESVRRLIDTDLPSGFYSIVWDGRNDSGQAVESGIYFYQIRTRQTSELRRMVLIR